jgi:hypothetical protein
MPHPRKRTTGPSKGRRTTTPRPCKDNTVTSGQQDRSPPSPSALCDHPRRPHAIPATASPSPTLWKRATTGRRHTSCCAPVRPHVNGTLESSHGRSPNMRPLHRHPRSRSWTRHVAPPEARFARTSVYSAAMYTMPLHVDKIVWHACKLQPPWPIKGGAAP